MTTEELIFIVAICALCVVIPFVCAMIDIRYARKPYQDVSKGTSAQSRERGGGG